MKFTAAAMDGFSLLKQSKKLDPSYKFRIVLERKKTHSLVVQSIVYNSLTLLHSERPKLHRVLAVLSVIGLTKSLVGLVKLIVLSKSIAVIYFVEKL